MLSRYLQYCLVAVVVIVFSTALLYAYETSAPTAVENQTHISAVFGGVSLNLEFADTPESRELGLSGRTKMPEDGGMLFIFEQAQKQGFWMKDMLMPIDIFWLDDKGQVVSIVTDVATSSYPDVFYPSVPARYVLETVAGFANANNIATGTQLDLQNLPTVSQ